MLPAFKLGVGGVLGSGKQYMSWIALEDLLGIFEHTIYTTSVEGPINAVAPSPVTNREFTKTLGEVLHRPTIMATPAPILRLLFGEVADEALLASNRIAPRALMESGYSYVLPNLRDALRFECGIYT
jgi:NAD dependent epimerase/dehydratase family enzyme